MRARLEPQPMGYAFSYIRKAGPNANGARTEGWGKQQNRHLFARVVGAAPGRVVAMVGGQHQEIVLLDCRDKLRQTAIESHQRLGITRNIAPVAIFLVEIDEIGDDQRPVMRHCERLERAVEQGHVAGGLELVGDALAGEDIGDLAYGKHITTGRLGAGGGMAKSRRLAVRLKVVAVSPVKGRAMTRPIRMGAV